MLIFLTSVNLVDRTDSDECSKLISKIADGDKDALSRLYENTKASVYGFALSILKNAHDAEDVLQNCFVNIWQNADSYRDNGKPMSWILKITKNLCLMKIRKDSKTAELNDRQTELLSSNDNFEENAADKMVLQTALSILSDDERQIVMLHAVSGIKFREIASLMSVPTATVLSKYHRAIAKLKKKLEE